MYSLSSLHDSPVTGTAITATCPRSHSRQTGIYSVTVRVLNHSVLCLSGDSVEKRFDVGLEIHTFVRALNGHL